jgi:hypothetical protein
MLEAKYAKMGPSRISNESFVCGSLVIWMGLVGGGRGLVALRTGPVHFGSWDGWTKIDDFSCASVPIATPRRSVNSVSHSRSPVIVAWQTSLAEPPGSAVKMWDGEVIV